MLVLRCRCKPSGDVLKANVGRCIPKACEITDELSFRIEGNIVRKLPSNRTIVELERKKTLAIKIMKTNLLITRRTSYKL